MKKYIYAFLLLLTHGFVIAQDTARAEEVATGMRSDGKIYVVVAVLVTILIGLFLYIISLDRKITRLEKKNG
jgi:TRAP-type C4-dicarboxylate transport system permease small subunit